MLADVELRQQTQGRLSLDTVLAEFAACHLPSDKMWRVKDFLSTLDQLSESDIFLSLYRRYADSARFPDLSKAYDLLGLSVDRDGTLQLNNAAPGLNIRTAMTGARSKPEQVASCPADSLSVS